MAKSTQLRLSAPGKVILFGEHAVVYGKTAIAASLGLRNRLILIALEESVLRLRLPDVQVDMTWSLHVVAELKAKLNAPTCSDYDVQVQNRLEDALVSSITELTGPQRSAVLAFWYLLLCMSSEETLLQPFEIVVQSEIPVGAGLGSSASYSVCVAAALVLHLTGQHQNDAGFLETVNRLAFVAECVIHGTPSGIDNTVCTFGGAVVFQRGGRMTCLKNFESNRFLLTNTLVPRNTKRQVEIVREYYTEFPEVVLPILSAIENISLCFEKELENHGRIAPERMAKCLKLNHCLISSLGVGHESLERICSTTERYDFSSKLTGAGGGGCAITFIPPGTDESQVEQIKSDLTKQGFVCMDVNIGGKGLEVEMDKTTM